jgi:beta-N-acetylglucosaminidase
MLASGVPTDPEMGADGPMTVSGLAVWTGSLERGDLALSDLLLRSFTGTRYLLAGEDDDAFVAAVYAAVLDRVPTDEEVTDSATLLEGSGNRLFFLSGFLKKTEVVALGTTLGFTIGAIPVKALSAAAGDGTPAEPIRADATRLLPESGGYAFGRKGAEGTVDLDGRAGRVDFLLDGALTNQILATPGIDGIRTGDSFYGIEWDASAATPGSHEVVVLARRADGRALRIDGGTYQVPVLHDMGSGEVLSGFFSESGRDDFYRTPYEGGFLAFHAAYPEAGVSLSAFDAAGEPIDASLTYGTEFYSIRFQSEPGQTVYVQATRSDATAQVSVSDVPTYYAVLDADVAVVHTYTASTTLRDAPGSASAAVGKLLKGEVVAVVGDGVDPDGDSWLKVRTNEMEGYAYSEVLHALRFDGRLDSLAISLPGVGPVHPYPEFDAETLEYGLVLDPAVEGLTLSYLVREGALADVEIAVLDDEGVPMNGLPGSVLAIPPGQSTLRLRVSSADRTSVREYLFHVLRPPSADGFSATLDAFPASYRSALWLLHSQRPQWSFVPFDTGISFAEFIAGESERDRCLLPEGSVPASFIEPGSPVYDGETWKAASDAAISHFADPRNFLLQRELFQFERLSFVEGVQTAEGVASIFKGTFFEQRVQDTDGQPLDFAELFAEAGRESGVGPLFLASRAVQEMGSAGTPLGLGTLPGYEGVFNFFNIGAVPDPSVTDGQRINGAKFALFGFLADEQILTDAEKALLLPWTSRNLAVRGGALYIASSYIGIGQDTQYLQKFDLVASDGLFMHQYMQNLLAPRNEGRRQRLAYLRTDLLDEPFVFRIPYFTDMPEVPSSEPQ